MNRPIELSPIKFSAKNIIVIFIPCCPDPRTGMEKKHNARFDIMGSDTFSFEVNYGEHIILYHASSRHRSYVVHFA